MYRLICLIFFLISASWSGDVHGEVFSLNLDAAPGEGLKDGYHPRITYEIKSDVFDESIPEGSFVLRGKVKNGQLGKLRRMFIHVRGGTEVQVDGSGHFNFTFNIADTILMHKDGYGYNWLHGSFESQHAVKIVIKLGKNNSGIAAKPVIYAYDAPGQCSMSLQTRGELTFTYPFCVRRWQFTTNTDGSLTDMKTNKKYPYIFWEGIDDTRFQLTNNSLEGYVIRTDTCARFLENVLTAYGLNKKEMADFITYWAPQMVKEKYALVQFLSTADYEKRIAQLTVSPKPDAMLRLYMYFMPLKNAEPGLTIVAPEVETFNRSGFTIVEWGGTKIPNSNPDY